VSEQMPEERRKRKGRSPSYPGITLSEALDKVAVLYKEEGRHPAHIEVITSHWGYKPKTGPGLVAIAALKKYGLLEDAGDNGTRRARLTDRALSILLGEADSPDRQRLMREAALAPPIHAELWEQFGGRLPSDQNLRRVLELDRAFTTTGAGQFIRQFRSTIAFAGLGEPDKMPEAEPPQHRPSGDRMAPQTIRPAGIESQQAVGSARVAAEEAGQSQVRTLLIPVDADPAVWPVLQVPIPMTEELWEQMLATIAVFKHGVVRKTASTDGPPPVQPSSAAPSGVPDDTPE
jgi:hypothetical protein